MVAAGGEGARGAVEQMFMAPLSLAMSRAVRRRMCSMAFTFPWTIGAFR
jgi:hypothetical protein